MRIVVGISAAVVLVIGLAAAASAHNMTVTHPKTGEVIHQQWVSGLPLPPQADGKGLFFHPPTGLNQPAGHREGIPNACEGTQSSPAVSITAPPFFTGCVHGRP